ncbi:hypothetical protein VTI28DRAFT_1062 [Corynascus sepedonium]
MGDTVNYTSKSVTVLRELSACVSLNLSRRPGRELPTASVASFPFRPSSILPHIEPAFYCRSFPHEAILLCQVYPDCNWASNHTVSTPQLRLLPFSALRAIDMAMLPREPHHGRVTHVQFHNCPPQMLIPHLGFFLQISRPRCLLHFPTGTWFFVDMEQKPPESDK